MCQERLLELVYLFRLEIGIERLWQPDAWLAIGVAHGLGAMSGDVLKSFFKRRRSIAPGLGQRAAAEAYAREETQQRAELVVFLSGRLDMNALARARLHWPVAGGNHRAPGPRRQCARAISSQNGRRPRAGHRRRSPPGAPLAATDGVFEQKDPTGADRLYAVKRAVTSDDLTAPVAVVVSVPKAHIYESANRALAQTLAGTGAVTVLLVLLTWLGAGRLVLRPIHSLLDMTRRVRAGELSPRTSMKAGREELSQLGAALDDMAFQLESRDRKLQQALIDLCEKAMTDALTGLYSRRYFWDALTRQTLASERKGTCCSVVLIDIDHFKQVNDSLGHDAGDQVLQHIAGVIQSSVRGSDIAARYGGEEFALLLPEADTDVARNWAESLRARLQATEVLYGRHRIKVTASFGVAEYGPDSGDAAQLMKAVNEAMYAAKEAGRNRVIVRSTPISSASATNTRP